MSTLSLRLPNSLHDRLRQLSEAEGVSMNQFISTAVAEKMAALMTEDYLEKRAARGSRERFANALSQIPDRPSDPEDAR
ncbi:MAG: putative DNA-binding protein [Rhodothermales bacterium]|jgi:predicted DNA-binding protein